MHVSCEYGGTEPKLHGGRPYLQPLGQQPARLRRYRWLAIAFKRVHTVHAQLQALGACHAHPVTRAQRLAADHPPVFAANFGIYHAVLDPHHGTLSAEHGFVATDRTTATAANRGGTRADDDDGTGQPEDR